MPISRARARNTEEDNPFIDQFAGLVIEDEYLKNSKAAAISGLVAIAAAFALHAVGAGQLAGLQVQAPAISVSVGV